MTTDTQIRIPSYDIDSDEDIERVFVEIIDKNRYAWMERATGLWYSANRVEISRAGVSPKTYNHRIHFTFPPNKSRLVIYADKSMQPDQVRQAFATLFETIGAEVVLL